MGQVFLQFLWLGCISFGGPAAHIGYFQRTFVQRLGWLSQAEYAQLLADKKKAYGEYRQARATMRELLTVKNNVDRVLTMEQTEPQQKEKDRDQR